MKTITLSPAITKALLQSVEQSIDMLNDLALDPVWFNPQSLRELAGKSDEEIGEILSKNTKEAYANIDQLVSLELLRADLLAE